MNKVEFLKERGWEHIMTDEEGCDTWTYPWAKRKEWPQWVRDKHGTQHYWDMDEAIDLESQIVRPTSKRVVYDGYGWIKVKRHVDDESKTWEERFRSLEEHHIKETSFLIEEIRRLASEMDEATRQKAG